MDLQLFFDNFEIIAAAPNGVKKLRELILQLAVRGKLVAQDAADEPAGKLLERISKSGKSKISLEQAAAPYELPKQWIWARFPEIGEFGRGKSKHRPRNDPSLYHDGCYPFVQTGDVARANAYISTYTSLYNETGLAQSKLWKKGTLCITIAANIADTAILDFDACFPDSVVGFVPFNEVKNVQYFMYFMRTAKEHLLDYAPSTAQKNINLGILEELLIPLPPIQEMGRIVAKVDELMKLCDRLETQQQRNRSHLTQMQKSAIAQLLSAPDADAFAQHWQDIVENFELLFDDVGAIDDLRQAILQLAMQGKLVRQDSGDEPVVKQLEKVKKQRKKQISYIVDESFCLPDGWEWTCVGEVSDHCLGKMLDKSKNKGFPLPYLRNLNVRWQKFDLSDVLEMPFEEHESSRFGVEIGDILICEGGEPGRAAIWQGEIPNMKFQKALHRVRPTPILYNHFLVFRLMADAYSGELDKHFTGATFKHFTGQELARYSFPLPPLVEQKRIVAKVNQLMTLCDSLQSHLTQRQQQSIDLAEVAVRQVLDRK